VSRVTAVVAPEESASQEPERVRPPADREPRASWVVAALLSLVVPGLGHFYARRVRRGLVWALLPIVLGLGALSSMRIRGPLFLLPFVLLVIHAVLLRLGSAADAGWVVRREATSRLSILRTVLAAAAILSFAEGYAAALKHFVVEAFKIPSGSMLPTLFVGDHVFIDKLRGPVRGDPVVFPFPEHPSQSFLKRIIGMPGETLVFRGGGHPVINGVEVPSCRVGGAAYRDVDSQLTHRGDVYLEVLGDRRYLTFYDAAAPTDDQGPYMVKDGEVFVVGDNRGNAHDSRMWYGGEGGGVPLSTVSGVAVVIWLAVTEHGVDWSREGLDLETLQVPSSLGDLQSGVDACLAKVAGTSL
jgi:signal peptidase I